MYSEQLRNEIIGEINKIDIVDPHTHLKEDHLSSNVVDILSYHWVLSELNSVGLDYQDVFMNPDCDLDSRLKSILPYFPKMRNTATSRCIHSIFRDLYGFNEELDESNYKKLLDISLKSTKSDGWADKVIEKTHISQFVTGAGNESSLGNKRSNFDIMAELNYICWPTGSTDNLPWFGEFALDDTKYIAALEKVGEIKINSAKDLRYAIDHFLRSLNCGRIKFYSTYLPIDFRFESVDDSAVNEALANYKKSDGRSKKDLDVLVHFVTWSMLETLNDIKTTLQIAVGAEYFICGGRSLSRFEPTWVSDMVKVCYRFPNIKFDFMNASKAMNHETAVAAKMIRNFYIQNMWWHTFVPSCIDNLYEKLEIVPMVKLGGFFCDAYYCELTYGKLQMVKDTIADVLCRKVENKVYSEEFAVKVANQLLHENPKNVYGI